MYGVQVSYLIYSWSTIYLSCFCSECNGSEQRARLASCTRMYASSIPRRNAQSFYQTFIQICTCNIFVQRWVDTDILCYWVKHTVASRCHALAYVMRVGPGRTISKFASNPGREFSIRCNKVKGIILYILVSALYSYCQILCVQSDNSSSTRNGWRTVVWRRSTFESYNR